MVITNYPLSALEILLDSLCLSNRYAPLIPYKAALLAGLCTLGCKTKADAQCLSDADFLQMGLDAEILPLLRRFFTLYDPNPRKFREIARLTADSREQAAFRELYCLPGVKFTRASLYYRVGYRSLQDIAEASPEEILEKTAQTIAAEHLSGTVPLPKEVRTHIAVAKAFTMDTDP